MSYTFEYGKQFAIEFSKYPTDQQDAILDFLVLYQQEGLGDFSKYPGKISPSWKGVPFNSPTYRYAYDNKLWHYHIGIPDYVKSRYGGYLTSDWVLHFIWDDWQSMGKHIVVVDILFHYKKDGTFHLPTEKYLERQGKGNQD